MKLQQQQKPAYLSAAINYTVTLRMHLILQNQETMKKHTWGPTFRNAAQKTIFLWNSIFVNCMLYAMFTLSAYLKLL